MQSITNNSAYPPALLAVIEAEITANGTSEAAQPEAFEAALAAARTARVALRAVIDAWAVRQVSEAIATR